MGPCGIRVYPPGTTVATCSARSHAPMCGCGHRANHRAHAAHAASARVFPLPRSARHIAGRVRPVCLCAVVSRWLCVAPAQHYLACGVARGCACGVVIERGRAKGRFRGRPWLVCHPGLGAAPSWPPDRLRSVVGKVRGARRGRLPCAAWPARAACAGRGSPRARGGCPRSVGIDMRGAPRCAPVWFNERSQRPWRRCAHVLGLVAPNHAFLRFCVSRFESRVSRFASLARIASFRPTPPQCVGHD